jgi:hypothetical protein
MSKSRRGKRILCVDEMNNCKDDGAILRLYPKSHQSKRKQKFEALSRYFVAIVKQAGKDCEALGLSSQ